MTHEPWPWPARGLAYLAIVASACGMAEASLRFMDNASMVPGYLPPTALAGLWPGVTLGIVLLRPKDRRRYVPLGILTSATWGLIFGIIAVRGFDADRNARHQMELAASAILLLWFTWGLAIGLLQHKLFGKQEMHRESGSS